MDSCMFDCVQLLHCTVLNCTDLYSTVVTVLLLHCSVRFSHRQVNNVTDFDPTTNLVCAVVPYTNSTLTGEIRG